MHEEVHQGLKGCRQERSEQRKKERERLKESTLGDRE